MKKSLLFATVFALSTGAFADTTATLNLKGTIGQVLSIAVTPLTVAGALDLTTTQTDLKVATSVEKSNSKTGYKVLLSSANNSKLKHIQGDLFAYTVKYGAATVDLSASAGTPVTAATVSTPLGVASNTRDVTVSYTGIPAANMKEGDYLDTLTFTIAAQ